MDANALRLSAEHFGFASILASILAGLMFSFNPVALASIPVALAYTTKARTPRQAFQFGTMFILGMFVTHAVLGLVAGLGSSGIKALLGRRWGLLLGPLLVLLGLMWAGWIRVPMPRIAFTGMRPDNPIGAFMLSIPFHSQSVRLYARVGDYSRRSSQHWFSVDQHIAFACICLGPCFAGGPRRVVDRLS